MADNLLLLKRIFGEPHLLLVNRDKLNDNADLNALIEERFAALAEEDGFLYGSIAPCVLEQDAEAAVAAYLRDNAAELAGPLLAHVLRFLRHPHSSRSFRPYMELTHTMTDAQWDAVAVDLLGAVPATDEALQAFIAGVQAGFDAMSGDKVDAFLAVRCDKDTADKNDPAVVALCEAAMEDLKKTVL